MSSQYLKLLEKNNQKSSESWMDKVMLFGNYAILAITVLAFLVWLMPSKSMTIWFIIILIIPSVIVLFVCFCLLPILKSIQEVWDLYFLLSSFNHFDEDIYKGGVEATSLVQQYLERNPQIEKIWKDLVVQKKCQVSWQDLHQSMKKVKWKQRIRWWGTWVLNKSDLPTENPFKTHLSGQKFWQSVWGREELEALFILNEKEVMSQNLPSSKISKKHARI